MTPQRFGEIIRSYDREQLRNFLPPCSRILEPPTRASDSLEIRLGLQFFEKCRYVYGYVGAIKRLSGSRNTTTSFLCQVVVKITWIDDSVPYPEHRCCFGRVLGYSADFADQGLGPEAIVSVRDFVQGMIGPPHGDEHTGANLTFWRFANIAELHRFPTP